MAATEAWQGRYSGALEQFRPPLARLGLVPWHNPLAPLLQIGCYTPEDYRLALAYPGRLVLMFCGEDGRSFPESQASALNALERPRCRVLAAPRLAADLRARGVKVDLVRQFYVGDPDLFRPAPLGETIHCYLPHARREEYGLPLLRAVAARLPGERFLLGRWGEAPLPFPNAEATPEWQPPAAMAAVYRRCRCGIRTVARDGFSSTLVELALMGRPVAHVTEQGPGWITHAPDVESLVHFLLTTPRQGAPDTDVADRARELVRDRSFLG